MIALRPNPLDLERLETIRLKARNSFVTAGNGAIMRRKLGQSLEYREHRPYAFGDDVRHIDWRASQRHGRADEFLVRSFEAEEQFQLLVVVDTGATMRAAMGEADRVSKLEVALWICEAMVHVAINAGIGLAFSVLGGEPFGDRVHFTQGAQLEEVFDHFVEDVWDASPPPQEKAVSVAAELSRLKQSSVTLFLSDLYQTGKAGDDFREAVQQASRGYRQAIVCELNSWPQERAILESGIVSLEAVGTSAGRIGTFQASTTDLAAAEAALAAQRRYFDDALNLGGVVHVPWDFPQKAGAEAVIEAFALRFHHFLLRSELFGRSA